MYVTKHSLANDEGKYNDGNCTSKKVQCLWKTCEVQGGGLRPKTLTLVKTVSSSGTTKGLTTKTLYYLNKYLGIKSLSYEYV